jgi:hypothetical protein
MIEKTIPQLQENEITENTKCKKPIKNTGSIYVIIGHGELREKPYIRYVGKTVAKPHNHLRDYISDAKRKGSKSVRPLYAWIQKCLFSDWKIEITPIAEMLRTDLGLEEKRYIAYFRTIYPDLLNVADGDEGTNNHWYVSETTREKLRTATTKFYKETGPRIYESRMPTRPPWNKGKHLSEETKQKIARKAHGKRSLDEHLQRMRLTRPKGDKHPFYGKHLAEETKQKISKTEKRIGHSGFKLGHEPWNTGKKMPKEYGEKSRRRMVGNKFGIGKKPWNKGKILTPEEKKNMRGTPGHIPWNKGKKYRANFSKEYLKRLSERMKNNELAVGRKSNGKHQKEETKEEIRKKLIGNQNFRGKHHSEETKERIRQKLLDFNSNNRN